MLRYANMTSKLDQSFQRIKVKATEIRIVVGGVTGNGKSTLLNKLKQMIGGGPQEDFKQGEGPRSETSLPKTRVYTFNGVTIKLTDNPGFLDTGGSETMQHQLRDIALNNKNSSYHALLYCIPINKRMDLAEQAVLEVLKVLYGPETFKYLIFVLTHADQVENVERIRDDWVSVLKAQIGADVLPVVAASPKDLSSYATVYEKIADIVEARPHAFQPPQITETQIRQAVEGVSKKMKIDPVKVFAAIVTIIPFIAAAGCTIL